MTKKSTTFCGAKRNIIPQVITSNKDFILIPVSLLAQCYRRKNLIDLQLYCAIELTVGKEFRAEDLLVYPMIENILGLRTATLKKRWKHIKNNPEWVIATEGEKYWLTPTEFIFPKNEFLRPIMVKVQLGDLLHFKDFVIAACIGHIEQALPQQFYYHRNGTLIPIYTQSKPGRIANQDLNRVFGYKSRTMASRVKCKALRGPYYEQFLSHLLKPNQIKGITYFEYQKDQTRKGGTR